MMKFVITVNGVRKEVEVSPERGNLLSVKVDGKAYSVAVDAGAQTDEGSAIAGSSYENSVTLDDAGSAPSPSLAKIGTSNQGAVALVGQEGGKPKSVRVVKSPLPGVVSSVEVRPGQRVEKGALLMYLESMKMLNDIVSPARGRVLEISKNSGDAVNIGDPLLTLEEDGE